MRLGVQDEAYAHAAVVEAELPQPPVVEDVVDGRFVGWKRMVLRPTAVLGEPLVPTRKITKMAVERSRVGIE